MSESDFFDDNNYSQPEQSNAIINNLYEKHEKSRLCSKPVRLELVKSMILSGMTTEIISYCTMLSQKEIDELRSTLPTVK